MVIPIYDHSPFKWPTPPYVMWGLLVVNFAIYFFEVGVAPGSVAAIDHLAGLIPAAYGNSAYSGTTLPAPLTLVTYMFLHANFMHVFGNMIFLFVFGDDIEEAIGHWRFLLFYLACGIGGGIAYVLSGPNSNIDLIGASGAVAGVISAYAMFRPCAKVTVLLGLIPLRLRAYWVIGLWVVMQIADLANGVQNGVAYWCHIGGLVTGAVLFFFMRPPGIKLFDCAHSEPVFATGEAMPPR
jgi:membrane associated rhomboid family serine protease